MTEIEKKIGSNGSNGHHTAPISEFIEITLFSPAESAKDGAKFTEIAKIPVTASACCFEGATTGHGRISADRLYIIKKPV